jgi:hypothetical protein
MQYSLILIRRQWQLLLPASDSMSISEMNEAVAFTLYKASALVQTWIWLILVPATSTLTGQGLRILATADLAPTSMLGKHSTQY